MTQLKPHIQDLCFLSANDLARKIRGSEISAHEVAEAHLSQIEEFNPAINAICTLVPREDILAKADLVDKQVARGEDIGPLAGLPIAIKDLAMTKGIRTTHGSRVFEHYIPDFDSLHVERIKKAGAIVIGKTNTPEFGAGSHTFNELFGMTHNPYDLTRSAGGSSGGAAAALASGMLPIADGSDLGGSLRNPASFCNIVGFRPSLGRIPSFPKVNAWQGRLGVEGPMARNVEDCASLFRVMAGPDIRDPISLRFENDLSAELKIHTKGLKIGWSLDLGGLPIEPVVAEVFNAASIHFESLGCILDDTVLDIRESMDVFKVIRASNYAESTRGFYSEKKHLLKSTLVKNIELGYALTGMDITLADKHRTQLYQRMLKYFESHDFLIVPSAQVEPFPCEIEWVKKINDVDLADYIDWMSICCLISVTGLPAISVPCGFSANNMPIGLQIIGPPGQDWSVLQMAKMFEMATGFGKRRPPNLLSQ